MKKLLGEVAVDSGTLWIGDPCYVIHQEQTDSRLGKDWNEFCDKFTENQRNPTNFSHLGIVVGTRWGDGFYSVYGNYDSDDNLSSITISLK